MSQLSQNCWALEVANGDGTVPLISAQASSWSPAENVHWVRETHAGLPGNQHVISAVEAILSGGKPSTLLNAPSRFSPLTQASLCTVSMVSPAKLSQAQAIESEPVATLTLRTSAGELVDDEHEGLVGSGHVRIGNGFHIWAPLGAGNQTIEIGGMDSGILSLEISEFGQDGELRRRTGFDNVAVQRGSVGSVEVSDSGPSALNYDLTGGGDPQEIAQVRGRDRHSTNIHQCRCREFGQLHWRSGRAGANHFDLRAELGRFYRPCQDHPASNNSGRGFRDIQRNPGRAVLRFADSNQH